MWVPLALLLLATFCPAACVQLIRASAADTRPAASRADIKLARRASRISPRQLTHLLSTADSPHHLLRAYERHSASVAPIHVGAFWSRLSKLARADAATPAFASLHAVLASSIVENASILASAAVASAPHVG